MKHINTDKIYLILQKWWESIDLTNFEKNKLNKEIISFNQQLFRLKEKQLRIGISVSYTHLTLPTTPYV